MHITSSRKHLSRKEVNWTDAVLTEEPFVHCYEKDGKRVGGISIHRSRDGV